MKIQIFSIIIIMFLIGAGCSSQQKAVSDGEVSAEDNQEVAEEDSLEHDLLIFDSDFESWFARNSKPMSFYDHSYLKRWNGTLSREWNSFSGSAYANDCRPVDYLNYDSRIEYDKELDYKLFYYFEYMHERCRLFRQTPGEWRN